MRIFTWNVNKRTTSGDLWGVFRKIDPDIALLQEVSVIPEEIEVSYSIKSVKATAKHGGDQRFDTAVLVKG